MRSTIGLSRPVAAVGATCTILVSFGAPGGPGIGCVSIHAATPSKPSRLSFAAAFVAAGSMPTMLHGMFVSFGVPAAYFCTQL